MPSEVCGGDYLSIQNVNGCIVEVFDKSINKFPPHIMMDVITYPGWGLKSIPIVHIITGSPAVILKHDFKIWNIVMKLEMYALSHAQSQWCSDHVNGDKQMIYVFGPVLLLFMKVRPNLILEGCLMNSYADGVFLLLYTKLNHLLFWDCRKWNNAYKWLKRKLDVTAIECKQLFRMSFRGISFIAPISRLTHPILSC